MLRLPTGRRRKWIIITAAAAAVALVAGVGTWQVVEWHEREERAELAAELAGEGVPPSLAKHLADTLPESKIESMEGPTSAAEDHFLALAYPDKDISLAKATASHAAISRLESRGRGNGPKIPGLWSSLGPTKAVYPAVLNRHNSEYVTSGRVTSLALDPACSTQRCTLWAAAAGGGVWRTDKALAGDAGWVLVSATFPTSNVGALYFDAPRNILYAGTGEANASGDSGAGQGVFKSTDRGNTWTKLAGSGPFTSRAIANISVDPASPSTLYVATTRAVRGYAAVTGGAVSIVPGAAQWGLYKSTDGGATFTFIHNGSANATDCVGDQTEAVGGRACSPRGVRSFAVDPVRRDR